MNPEIAGYVSLLCYAALFSLVTWLAAYVWQLFWFRFVRGRGELVRLRKAALELRGLGGSSSPPHIGEWLHDQTALQGHELSLGKVLARMREDAPGGLEDLQALIESNAASSQAHLKVFVRRLTAAAPAAGAAGTMSGVMQTLGLMQEQQEGMLGGMRDALATTLIGCALVFVGIVFSAVGHRVIRGHMDRFAARVKSLVAAHEWAKAQFVRAQEIARSEMENMEMQILESNHDENIS